MSTSWTFFAGASRVVGFWATASSEPRDDNEVDEGEFRGLSRGEILAEDEGVESVVAKRRRAASEGRAVVVMVVLGVAVQAR